MDYSCTPYDAESLGRGTGYEIRYKLAGELIVKIVVYIFMFLPVFLVAGFSVAQEYEDSTVGASDDCSEISVNYEDDPNLTGQEKIELMDRALLNSLNKYERCQNSRSSSAAGDAGASGEAGNAGAQGASAASSEMSGTEASAEQEVSTSEQTGEAAEPANKARDKRNKSGKMPGNGKVPDDIPPADNDSILEEQIRQAAINEQDPVIKAKLWNEYRKYKGLPLVSKP